MLMLKNLWAVENSFAIDITIIHMYALHESKSQSVQSSFKGKTCITINKRPTELKNITQPKWAFFFLLYSVSSLLRKMVKSTEEQEKKNENENAFIGIVIKHRENITYSTITAAKKLKISFAF